MSTRARRIVVWCWNFLHRVLVMFVLLYMSYVMLAWGWYNFRPRATYFEWHSIRIISYFPATEVLLLEVDRTVRYEGLYVVRRDLECRDAENRWVTPYQGDGLFVPIGQGAVLEELLPSRVRWHVPGAFGDEIRLPATCRPKILVAIVNAPFGAIKQQLIVGEETTIE